MVEIFPLLYVGNSTDAYMELYVHDKEGEAAVDAVLDVTLDVPTKKWHRAKHLKLKKVGIASGMAMSTAQLQKCLDFIQTQRSEQKKVLVHCRNGQHRSILVCIAYLCVQKNLTWVEACDKVRKPTLVGMDFKPEQEASVKKFIEKKLEKVGG
jgi:protein-tyrosine phosphatase